MEKNTSIDYTISLKDLCKKLGIKEKAYGVITNERGDKVIILVR